ncbi:Biotin/lipoyl attachment domain-containing protein [Cupriavidus sp. H18C1]|uniref:lipoyl domain-containing protein n=1 Tax=Cupriavidus sp. H18C1 TaxID=3241601 RepID=UPI003BB99E6A
MTDVTMADDVWADVEEGTEALLQDWQVNVGDSVAEGQTLVVAELVKTTHEIVAPVPGRIAEILVQSQDTFARGAVLARIEE